MAKEKIFPIPDLPQEIIDAVNNDQLALFIGAGASIQIGCSSWEQLAGNLIKKCFETPSLSNPSNTCINFKERETLFQMKDPKKTITICHYILEKNGLDNEFYNELENSLGEEQGHIEKENLYNELNGLRGLSITTNIDKHFDKHFISPNIVIRKENFVPSEIDRTKLYHIHGSISDRSSIVLTVKQYFDLYNDEQFRAFLKTIFEKYVVLFIGYGLNEFEILDFLIPKSKALPPGSTKHFILLPYFQGEEAILEFEEQYYAQMGISVIPYAKDERGYGQLYYIIQQWNKEILLHSRFLHDSFGDLKDAANNYDPNIENKTIQLIKSEHSLEIEFFKQLAQSTNPYPWLKPLREYGYFDPRNNPYPSGNYGMYWNVMPFLERIAKLNHDNPSDVVTKDIISIINSIIEYRDETGQRVENGFTDEFVVRVIFLLPPDRIDDSYFDFIRICLNSRYEPILIAGEIGNTAIPEFIRTSQSDILLNILDIVLDFKKNESESYEQYSSLLGPYYLDEVLKKFTEGIVQICDFQAIDIALQKIEVIVAEDRSQFDEIWNPSIKAESEIDRYESNLIRFIWSGFMILGPLKIQDTVRELLKKKHPIFRRIAICAIDTYYSELKNLFWNWEINPLNEYHLKHELYGLFSSHCKEFSGSQIQKIIGWIEAITSPDYLSDDLKEQKNYLAYHKKEWLSSLLGSDDPGVMSLYQKYDSINPAELIHPGRNYGIEPFSETESPISKEDLLLKTNEKIVQYLNDFNENENFSSKFSALSLSRVFQASIKENPQKYVEDLCPFLELKRPYQYGLFRGLSEAWRAEKNFKWDGIFDFIDSIIGSESFWAENYPENWFNYRNQIISEIAVLIEEGTKADNHLFDLSLLPQAEEILLILSSKAESDLPDMGDLVTSVLNSSKGKIYSAMVNYSLCVARHNPDEEKMRWVKAIKDDFEKRLDPAFEPSVEFSVTVGEYLANLLYLDENWVKENINRLFPKENEEHWRAAFTGYLFYSSFHVKIYTLLKSNDHYLKALTMNFTSSQINERLIQHISLAYLNDIESLDDEQSLMNKVLDLWNPDQILEIIVFIRWYGKQIPLEKHQKIRPQKILPLWRKIYLRSSLDLDNLNNKNILSELFGWISLVDELDDESSEWLKCSARYVNKFMPHVIEELIRHAEKTPQYVGEIFFSMSEAGCYFNYQAENVITLVSILYDKKQKKIADAICNVYLQVGFDFLNPIYEQNLTK